jgi:hypothetical protein
MKRGRVRGIAHVRQSTAAAHNRTVLHESNGTHVMTGFHSSDRSFRRTQPANARRRSRSETALRRRRPQFEHLEARLVLSGQPSAVFSPTFVAFKPFGSSTPFQTAAPSGLTPAQLRHAYGLDQITGDGTGQTIAIIDAYDSPTIQADLTAFDAYWTANGFNLPDPPTFTKVSQTGSPFFLPPPAPAGSWEVETSLDVEWSHVMAPGANILLVEANSPTDANLITAAVNYAKAQPGVVAVSMSFGHAEIATEKALDKVFTTPVGHTGVTFLASTGDSGAPGGYPAYSPNVVAVGGTTLTLDPMGNYMSETAWGNGPFGGATGGGISTIEAQPSYQKGIVTQSTTKRTIPDVAFDADPASGVPVYDSTDFGAMTPWEQIGGTSLACPCWAGIIAVVDQLRVAAKAKPLDGPTQTLPRLYGLPATDFNDITIGNNFSFFGGFTAAPGYDLTTGRGTPIVQSLAGDEAGIVVVSSTPANGTTVVATPPTDFSITLSAPYNPASVKANDLKVNGIAANSFTLTSPTVITFHYTTTPVTTQGVETMSVAAGLIGQLGGGPTNSAFSATFRFDALVIAVDSTTPANGSAAVAPLTSLTVHFNEAFDPTTINNSNLTLSQGSVSGFTIVDTQTVTYNLTGVTAVGPLQISMPADTAADTVTDTFGNAGAAYSGNLILTNAPVAFPALIPVPPPGSLIYTNSVTGAITTGSVDAYSLPVAAGQTISVLVTPDTGLQPQITLSGADVATSAAGTAAGSKAVIQTVATDMTDTYVIAVLGLNGSAGNYTIQVYLNAAFSSSNDGGNLNQTLVSAQNINSSFTPLGAESPGPVADRGAVAGNLVPGGLGPDAFGYTAFSIAPQFVDISATGKKILVGVNDGFTQLSSLSGFKPSLYGTTYTSVFVSSNGLITFGSGNPSFVNTDLSAAPLQAAIAPFWNNLVVSGGVNSAVLWQVQGTGANQRLILQWNQCSFYAGNHTGQVTFEAILNADGSIIFNYKNLTTGDYGSNGAAATVGVENTAAQAGDRLLISYESAFGNLIGNGKSIEITANPPAGMTVTAYYAFNLVAGQTVSIVGSDGLGTRTVSVGVLNSKGASVASGTALGNGNLVSSSINNFVARTSGTYYATVTGTSGTFYSLVVTRAADFGLETNGTMATAQNISGTNGVLSEIGSDLLPPPGSFLPTENWYSINLTAGTQITLQAYVLGDPVAQFVDSLTPNFTLYDPTLSNLIGSFPDPVSGLQSITTTAAISGTYRVDVGGANGGEYFLSVATAPPPSPMIASGGGAVLPSGLGSAGSTGSLVSGANAALPPSNSSTVATGTMATASSPSQTIGVAHLASVIVVFPLAHVAAPPVAQLHDLMFAQIGDENGVNGPSVLLSQLRLSRG